MTHAVITTPELTCWQCGQPAQRAGHPLMSAYPARTADTMSDAIALSSPNGRMSKRAQEAASRRLSLALFGPGGYQPEPMPQPSERDRLLRQVTVLRDLADRGMRVRTYRKEADRLEALAAQAA